MPNCDFYATKEDHEGLLTWLFAEESCDVYELASDFEQPLKCFRSAAEVLAQFERSYPNGKKWRSVHLQLYVRGAGPAFEPRRVELDPVACGGATFRYDADGWGLVQLYLGSASAGDERLEDSHTNHNSLKRAQSWSDTVEEMGDVGAWDFAKITSFSSRLNREIRKRGVAKVGSRAVLPGALKLWDIGVAMGPYKPGEYTLQRLDT
ncbi:hypothetical protein [Variovorax paradoxus]|uniref:Uncharacterized protein n=1 Tax=Variovorax paradoxus TaxID=34073 RepID=A0A6I6HN51_VARPD|nr:hypothetical protein [Variovorax paradoxus]QGW84255.1 hypothetical protein GOQ09_22935 [Variovorax paradoxus]